MMEKRAPAGYNKDVDDLKGQVQPSSHGGREEKSFIRNKRNSLTPLHMLILLNTSPSGFETAEGERI